MPPSEVWTSPLGDWAEAQAGRVDVSVILQHRLALGTFYGLHRIVTAICGERIRTSECWEQNPTTLSVSGSLVTQPQHLSKASSMV